MKNSFVAFFDILGFKNLVEKNSHEDLIDIYKESLYESLDLTEKYTNPIYTAISPEQEKDSSSIKIFVISDSIILVQENLTILGFYFLLARCQVLLSTSLADGIPLRGAISYGPVSIIENRGTTIVGRGLTRAYTFEASQNWSGGMIDPECFKILNPQNPQAIIESLLKDKVNPLIIKYNIPLKDSKYISGFGFNWPKYALIRNEEDVLNSFTKHKKEVFSSKEELMIENTLKYYRHVKTLLKL
jgi:hypothetical protein